ncbi:unnamed protein product [Lactuca saligna]|uniref:Uncharacterized protein n=1 Tax=Lactuca saligna TaxID=75948 RepID=A0AA35UY92_LACSI|nr:unnamed protein product [Lactuca saligna]
MSKITGLVLLVVVLYKNLMFVVRMSFLQKNVLSLSNYCSKPRKNKSKIQGTLSSSLASGLAIASPTEQRTLRFWDDLIIELESGRLLHCFIAFLDTDSDIVGKIIRGKRNYSRYSGLLTLTSFTLYLQDGPEYNKDETTYNRPNTPSNCEDCLCDREKVYNICFSGEIGSFGFNEHFDINQTKQRRVPTADAGSI